MGASRAVWLTSKDVTVSCESNRLPGGATKARLPGCPEFDSEFVESRVSGPDSKSGSVPLQ